MVNNSSKEKYNCLSHDVVTLDVDRVYDLVCHEYYLLTFLIAFIPVANDKKD